MNRHLKQYILVCKRISILFVAFMSNAALYSQASDCDRVHFKQYTTNDGLSHNRINQIIRDSEGYMWIGTIKGLNRFDGYDFKKYTHTSNSNSLTYDNVQYLLEYKPGVLMIATEVGLNLFDTKREVFYRFYQDSTNLPGLPSDNINKIVPRDDSTFWIATEKGLTVVSVTWDNGQPKVVCYNDKLTREVNKQFNSPNIRDIHLGFDNILWVGTDAYGLLAVNLINSTIKRYEFVDKAGVSSNSVLAIYDDKDGGVWVGTASGLYAINKKENSISTFFYDASNEYGFTGDLVQQIYKDSRGKLWFATYNGLGLYNSNNNTFCSYRNVAEDKSSLSNNFVHSLYDDGKGILWVGTENGGVNLVDFNKKDFRAIKKEPGNPNALSGNIINSIYLDSSGGMWVGTSGDGLDYFDKQKIKKRNYRHNPTIETTISGDVISCIFQDKKGDMWFGTWGFGLNKLEKGKFGNYDFKRTLGVPYNFISDITEDSLGRLWVASTEGPLVKHPQTDSFVQVHLPDKNMHDLGEIGVDSKGYIYIPTSSNGLFVLHQKSDFQKQVNVSNESYLHFQPDKNDTLSIPRHLLAFHLDKNGTVWLSTMGSGIVKVVAPEKDITQKEKVHFIRYTEEDGLSDNVTMRILEDAHENLWVSTSNGLSRFNYKEERFTNYYLEDGLLENQFFWYSGCKDKLGKMYFGTLKGLNYFFPDSIKGNQNLPNVLVTDFQVLNKSAPLISKQESHISGRQKNMAFIPDVVLNPGENTFSFSFSASNYSLPERNKYAFMLEGFDTEWNKTSAENRNARYTNIPAGRYTFKVIASNNDGVWNNEGASFKIRVLPHWYNTILFKIGVFILAVLLIVVIYYWRLKSIRRQKIYLRAQIKKRTIELHKANKALIHQKEEILAQKQEIELQAQELMVQKEEVSQRNKEIQQNNELLQKVNNNVMVVSEFSKKISSTLNLDSINKIIYEYVSSLMPVTNLGIGIYNRLKRYLHFPTMFEEGKETLNFISYLDDKTSCAAWSFNKQESIISNNFKKEYVKYISKLYIRTSQVPQSVIYLPLNVDNSKIGILTVQTFIPNAYTDYDIAILETLASSIAIALENSNAYTRVREANKELRIQTEILNDTNTKLEERQQQIEEQSVELRVQTEELYYANENLTEANTTKNKLFSIIGHDLKNPLNSIIGFMELILLRYDKMDDEKRKYLLGTVFDSAQSLFKLLENLLNWSRSLSGNFQFNAEKINIEDAVNNCTQFLSEMAQAKNNMYNIHIMKADHMVSDRNILDTLLRNLISNAIKFTENGVIEISALRKDGETIIEVKDTGVGMKPEVAKTVFDIKSAKSTKGTKGEKGTGLGLILCKEFIEKLHGKIWVESELGKGTSFYLKIPDMELK